MITITLTEQEACLIALILSDLHNGDCNPEDGIDYDEQATRAVEQKLYDAGVDSELMYERSRPEEVYNALP